MSSNNHNSFDVSPPLFPRINEGAYSVYLDLMKAFWQSVKRHNGSSHANETSVNHLIAVEDHIKNLFDNAPIPYELEEEFFRSAVLQSDLEFDDALPDTGDFNLLLDRITHRFNARMQHLSLDDKENEFFQTLEEGGAIIINHQDDIFVPTDPSRAHIVIGDGDNNSDGLHQFAPKFAQVIDALRSIGIFTDDLVIHRGVVGKNMVRNAPYHLIQIPELDAEIAVCNRIGEVILVGCPIRGAHLFKTYDKALLVKSLGIEPVRYQGDWQTKLCALVLGDQPEAREKRTRPDIKSFAKSQTQPSRPIITAEMIVVAMLEYANQFGYALPAASIEEPCPSLHGMTWKRIDSYVRYNLKVSLSQIKQDYGLAIGQLNLSQSIYQAVLNFKENGILPEKMPKPDITIEDIVKAILEYANHSDGELPDVHTKASCLSLYGRTWKVIDKYLNDHFKTSLSKIEQDYGLAIGRLELMQPIYQAVLNFKEKGILPEKMPKPDITIGDIVKVILAYANHSDGELPVQLTKFSSVSLYGLRWRQIESHARNTLKTPLAEIKEKCGFIVEETTVGGQEINTDKVAAAVSYYQQHRNLPPDLLVALGENREERGGGQNNIVFGNPTSVP